MQSAKVPVLWMQANWSIVQLQQLEQLSNTILSESMATPKPVQVDLKPGTTDSKEDFYDKYESTRR